MRTRRLGLLCWCLLVLGTIGAATATAVPPPTPFCSACGDAFEADVAEEHPAVAVEASTATIDVHENGSASWVVRNRLSDAASAEALVEDSPGDHVGRYGGPGSARLTGASVDGERTLVLRFHDPAFAEPVGGGTLRSGAFTSEYGYRNYDGLGADQLTVEAPRGTRVDWTVPGATVSDDGSRTTLTAFERGGFVTFVPRDRAAPALSSAAAVGALVGPSLLENAVWLAVLPAVLVGSLVAGVGTVLVPRPAALAPVRRHATAGLAALGGLLLAVGLGTLATVESGGAAAIGLGLGLVAFAATLHRRQRHGALDDRRLAGAVASAVCVAVVAALAIAVARERPDALRAYPWRTLVVVPLLGAVLAGVALGSGRRGLAAATIALGLVVVLLPTVPVGSAFLGWLGLALQGTVSAVLLAAVSAPFVVVGVALAGDETARSERGTGT